MKKMKTDSRMPSYMPYPHFLKSLPINGTARLVYAHLLGRAQLSQKNHWSDESGVYIIYPIADLAKDCGKCAMTIKSALKALEECDLIERKRMGIGRANKIYVHIPETISYPYRGQSLVPYEDKLLSRSNKAEALDPNYCFETGESL